MTQQIPQELLEAWCAGSHGSLAEYDLLSLRAVVRRVLAAEGVLMKDDVGYGYRSPEETHLADMLATLRAEMASIDCKEGKP